MTMSFTLPEELQLLQRNLRRYVDTADDPARAGDDGRQRVEAASGRRRFEQGMKDLGVWMLDVPEEYGGAGLGLLAKSIVWQELGRTVAIPARGDHITGPSARGILYQLRGKMRERYLMPVLRGEKECCFAQTEPDAGSDPGSMRTTAVRDGDHYVINGTKRFITGAGKADFMQLMVATDRAKGSQRRHLLLPRRHGYARREARRAIRDDDGRQALGDHPRQRPRARHHLVGEEGERLQARARLARPRPRQARRPRTGRGGALAAAGDRLFPPALTFGRPLADRQGIQWMLGDMYMDLDVGKLLV